MRLTHISVSLVVPEADGTIAEEQITALVSTDIERLLGVFIG